MQVPLLDLKAQYQRIKGEINAAIQKVLDSQQFILGPSVKKLEEEIASYCQTHFAVGVASGTDALILSLRAAGIGIGDEVITSPFTFFATAGAIHNIGARPVFVDIKPDTFNIDPDKLCQYLETRFSNKDSVRESGRLKAIIPVHLFGQMADMRPILEVAQKYGLKVIEDAAQAIGAEYENRRAGSFGELGCFSFFPSKNLGGYGDGGMVVTNDEKLAQKVRMLRVHGSRSRYEHSVVGYNSRLDSLQAAVLRVKLRYLDEWSEKRRRNASYYNELFRQAGLTGNDSSGNSSDGPIIVPQALKGRRHTYHQYTIRVREGRRDELRKFLTEKGVGTAIYYPLPLHLQRCFRYLGYNEGDFPVAETLCKEVLSLPVYPELTSEMQEYVVDKVREFFKKG